MTENRCHSAIPSVANFFPAFRKTTERSESLSSQIKNAKFNFGRTKLYRMKEWKGFDIKRIYLCQFSNIAVYYL